MISAGDLLIRKDPRMKLIRQSLEISDVTEDDAGEYICNVETVGDPLDQEHAVTVLGLCFTLAQVFSPKQKFKLTSTIPTTHP